MKPFVMLVSAIFLVAPTIASAQKDAGAHEALLNRLASGDRNAVPAVIKEGEAILPELTKLLSSRPRDDHQSLMTFAVAEIASSIGSKAKGATPILCTLLKSQDKAVASDAARALGYIGAEATAEVVKVLKAAEAGVDGRAEYLNALRALRQIGPGAKESVPALLAVLKEKHSPHVHLACVEALGAIGPSGKGTVDALLELAKEKDPKRSLYTVQIILALGNQGHDGKGAIPYLVATVRQAPEPHLRIHALEALAKISPASKEIDDAVALMLDSPHVPKIMVLETLTKGAGPLSKGMIKAMEELMRDKDASVRLQAVLVYGKTKPNHPSVVSILIESLSDKDARTRRTAAEAIGTIRPSDEAVIEALQTRMKDSDPAVRAAVAGALEKFKK